MRENNRIRFSLLSKAVTNRGSIKGILKNSQVQPFPESKIVAGKGYTTSPCQIAVICYEEDEIK